MSNIPPNPECVYCPFNQDPANRELSDRVMKIFTEQLEEIETPLYLIQKSIITPENVYQMRGDIKKDIDESNSETTVQLVKEKNKLCLEALMNPNLDRRAIANCATRRLKSQCTDYDQKSNSTYRQAVKLENEKLENALYGKSL